METVAVILAAGKGTRMKSDLPKVLHQVAGRPMLVKVLDTLQETKVKQSVVILGHAWQKVIDSLSSYGYNKDEKFRIVLQEQQLGTGHAVMQTEQVLKDYDGTVLVVCGDTPLIKAATLRQFIAFHQQQENAATVLSVEVADPYGYGRIVREYNGQSVLAGDSAAAPVKKIVEQKDASAAEQKIKEINTGIYCFSAAQMFEGLKEIRPDNVQGEYYLTDIIEIFLGQNAKVAAWKCPDGDAAQFLGVNDCRQLAEAERILQERALGN